MINMHCKHFKIKKHISFEKKKRRCNHETRVLNGHTKRQLWQREKLPVRALHSPICRQKNFPPEYFLAADRRDIYIIKGDKNLIAFISLLLIQKKCIQKIIFLKMVCFRVDFPSQVSVQVPSHASVNKLCRQKLCKFVVHLVTSN